MCYSVAGVTFAVSPVSEPPCKYGPAGDSALRHAWSSQGRVLTHSHQPAGTIAVHTKNHLLAEAVHKAFYDHCPLALSPDAIWVTIMQGLAHHTAQSPEELRAAWGVKHEGKMTIALFRPEDYIHEQRSEPEWVSVINEFSDKITAVIGANKLALAECTFTTSTPIDAVVSRVALMDAVQHYFELTFGCGCGIPWITLLGTAQDWRDVRARVGKLRTFGLDWWVDELEPVLDQFVAAAEGAPDLMFWQSVCNLYGASGIRRPISGWVQVFFPYLRGVSNDGPISPWGGGSVKGKVLVQNDYLGAWRKDYEHGRAGGRVGDMAHGFGRGGNCGPGVDLDSIPAGISSAPFTIKHLPTGSVHSCAFLGGLACITQSTDTGELRVQTGWAVVEKHN